MDQDALVTKLRNSVNQYLDKQQYETALFWSDKLCSLSKNSPVDCYNLSKCMYLNGQVTRAAELLKKHKLHEKYAACKFLVAKCHFMDDEPQLALQVLENVGSAEFSERIEKNNNVVGIPADKEMESSVLLLKGKIYESQNNKELANSCYQAALRADIFCYEAFQRLTGHHMLSSEEENELFENLQFNQCDNSREIDLVKFLYQTKLNKYHKPWQFEVPESVNNISDNLSIATSLAERHYYNSEYQTCYKMTSAILRVDEYHSECLPLHVTVLTALKKKNELFYLAHKLVKKQPENVVSWYAVGCYYLILPKLQMQARRYLLKAASIDKSYGPAWLALGHSFGKDGEHDQAMAAYFTASQVMPGCHLPLVYIGLEYSVTNNFRLAERLFSAACVICPDDPQLIHEIGVAAYTVQNYYTALKFFKLALAMVEGLAEGEICMDEWEPLLNNLGHLHRQLHEYDEALVYHKRALALAPQKADTYACIGFVLCHKKEYAEALDYLHKSLSLRRDDLFVVTLLDFVISEFVENDKELFCNSDDIFDDSGHPPNVNESQKPMSCDATATEMQTVATPTPVVEGAMSKKTADNITKFYDKNSITPSTSNVDMFTTPDDVQPLPVYKEKVGKKQDAPRRTYDDSSKETSLKIKTRLPIFDETLEKSDSEISSLARLPETPEPSTLPQPSINESDNMDIDDTL